MESTLEITWDWPAEIQFAIESLRITCEPNKPFHNTQKLIHEASRQGWDHMLIRTKYCQGFVLDHPYDTPLLHAWIQYDDVYVDLTIEPNPQLHYMLAVKLLPDKILRHIATTWTYGPIGLD